MSTIFDARGIAPPHRCEAWSAAVAAVCGDFIVHFGASPDAFKGQLEAREAGGLEYVSLTQNACSVRRTNREVARADPGFVALILQQRGRSLMSQAGHEALLLPGYLTLIDSRQPSCFRFAEDCLQLVAHVPWSILRPRLRYRSLPLAHALRGGSAAIAAALTRSIFEHAGTVGAAADMPFAEALGAVLLTAAVDDTSPERVGRGERGRLLGLAQEYIEKHLSNSALSPPVVAQAHGISVRQLHRLFAVSGTTIGDWIRHRRLERCMTDLQEESLAGVTVTEIAYHWGFIDSAHFTRAFKAKYGRCPNEYRRSRVTVGQSLGH
jgi:AraC-like DNA-binding protein